MTFALFAPGATVVGFGSCARAAAVRANTTESAVEAIAKPFNLPDISFVSLLTCQTPHGRRAPQRALHESAMHAKKERVAQNRGHLTMMKPIEKVAYSCSWRDYWPRM